MNQPKAAFREVLGSPESPELLRNKRLLEAFPELDPGIEPFGARVLVQVRRAKNISAGGIHLTDETAETDKWNTQIARVISVGALAFKNRETLEPWKEGAWCGPGDYVRCPKYHGDRWEVALPAAPGFGQNRPDLVTFVIFRDLDIMGRITGDPLDFKAFIQ